MREKQKELLIIKARETTGKIFYSLIEGVISPIDAIKYFPKNMEDTSLKIAWHALLHYDADEDIRLKNPDYAQTQIEYMEFLAKTLTEGNALPQNILEEYEDLYIDTVMPKKYNWWGKLKALFRFID